MTYSIRHTTDTNNVEQTEILCSHSNHRGDIIARSDSTGSLTFYAVYEAYGTRPFEWTKPGTSGNPDRQYANTKDEETALGLLNEGMRYRDLYTGTFLTRDPIGYADGPNIYCYVHCNPITHFDALGLSESEKAHIYDLALLAKNSYRDEEEARSELYSEEIPEDYMLLRVFNYNEGKNNIGFSASLYRKRGQSA